MRELVIVLLCLCVGYVAGFWIGADYENNRISKCIIGNEIGVNYYHFAKVGKCLSK